MSDLFVLKDWTGPLEVSGVTLAEGLTFRESGFQWVGIPHVQVNPNMQIPEKTRARIHPQTKVVTATGTPLTDAPDFDSLANLLASRATAVAEQQGQPIDIKPREVRRYNFDIAVEFEAFIDTGDERIPVTQAQVTGDLTKVEKIITPELKALVKLGETKPYVGCAIFETSHGNLMGVTADRQRRAVLINIPVSARVLKKIFRQRLKSS